MRKKKGNTCRKTENGEEGDPSNPDSPYAPITSFQLGTFSKKGKYLKALSAEARKEAENFVSNGKDISIRKQPRAF